MVLLRKPVDRTTGVLLSCLVLVGAASLRAQELLDLPPAAQRAVDFQHDVRPLLERSCFSCHGGDEQEGGLQLDVRERAWQGGDSGPTWVVGDSASSRLILRVAGADGDNQRMPPENAGRSLSAEEIGILRAWIDQGSKWVDQGGPARPRSNHWSFQPLGRPPLPRVKNSSWVNTPVDAFVLARLENEAVLPAQPADRVTYMRRLYLDLLGLPPHPRDVDRYLADSRPDADQRLVDQVLASPHFGERWGRYWLDMARYADSDGYEKDRPRPFAWQYRDWVINSLNADVSYDTFSTAQIAGDLLPRASLADRIATGLHRNTLHNTEGGIDPEEDRVKKTVDRTNTYGAIWLGLTVGCAQCHSHKYDPITQREYYALYAFFNSLEEKDVSAPTEREVRDYQQAVARHREQVAQLEQLLADDDARQLDQALQPGEKAPRQTTIDHPDTDHPGNERAVNDHPDIERPENERPENERPENERQEIDPERRAIQQRLEALRKQPPAEPATRAQAVVERTPYRETRILRRGDFLQPGDPVHPDVPAVLPPLFATSEMGTPDHPEAARLANRLDLARWTFDAENPLTARVAANRVWQRLFGRGLSVVLDDLGDQGARPTHPELLDWLAVEFREADWSVKHLIRVIVLSSTYRQSSHARPDLDARDPDNELLARQIRRRVPAELVRDLAMAASGLLDARLGGPSVRPLQPSDHASLTYANSAKWQVSEGGDRYRRGLYTFFQRTSPYPLLTTFDAPDSTACAVQRTTSNTPLQALTVWNDRAFVEAAQALARRVLVEVPGDRVRREQPREPQRDGQPVAGSHDNSVSTQPSPQDLVRRRAVHAFRLCLAREPQVEELAIVCGLYRDELAAYAASPEAAAQAAGPLPWPPGTASEELAAWSSVARALLNLDECINRE